MFEQVKRWWGTTQINHDIRAILDSHKDNGNDCDKEGDCPEKGVPWEKQTRSDESSSA
jgi:hypothetical protein